MVVLNPPTALLVMVVLIMDKDSTEGVDVDNKFSFTSQSCQSDKGCHETFSRNSYCNKQLLHISNDNVLMGESERDSIVEGICTCKPYSHKRVSKDDPTAEKCLPGRLLGGGCEIDAQCQSRVSNSTCFNGRCACMQGSTAFRRHTCLAGSSVSRVCFSDKHCQLSDVHSLCHFSESHRVYGYCVCRYGPSAQGFSKCSNQFLQLGTPCFERGACPGIDHSVCKIVGEKENICGCLDGYEPNSNNDQCIPKVISNRFNFEALLSENYLYNDLSDDYDGSDDVSILSNDEFDESENFDEAVSLGYPCSSSRQCKKGDSRSTCSDSLGICVCSKWLSDNQHLDNESRRDEKSSPSPNTFKNIMSMLMSRGIASYGTPVSTFPRSSVDSSFSSLVDGLICDVHAHKGRVMVEKRSLCPFNTFQCVADGKCISRYFVCDGRPDCSDNSDEQCQYEENTSMATNGDLTEGRNCPQGSFTCKSSKKCLPVFKVCDGAADCIYGEDERNCVINENQLSKHVNDQQSTKSTLLQIFQINKTPTCPKTSFQCDMNATGEMDYSKQVQHCVPGFEVCNAHIACPDGSDEDPNLCKKTYLQGRNGLSNFHEEWYGDRGQNFLDSGKRNFASQRRNRQFKSLDNNICPFFTCSNGNCRSWETRCSGVDGCGDNSDEVGCSICKCPI